MKLIFFIYSCLYAFTVLYSPANFDAATLIFIGISSVTFLFLVVIPALRKTNTHCACQYYSDDMKKTFLSKKLPIKDEPTVLALVCDNKTRYPELNAHIVYFKE